MGNLKDVKKWDYEVISDDTIEKFNIFNKLYEKDRESARYYIINKQIYSTRIVSFIKKNVHIIIKEQIKYGVSITLKKYKSTKTIQKIYLDTNNGSISKSVKGKFIACKPSDILEDIKSYITSKIKWIDFVFKLNLPVTFTTIVSKKLYSHKKLLKWFWGCDYKLALNFTKNYSRFFYIRNNKNIININNLNSEFFTNNDYYNLFIQTLALSIKSNKKINAVWSFRRLKEENKKLNKYILNKLYSIYNYKFKISDAFLPILKYLENNNFNIPRTSFEFSQICDDEAIVRDYLRMIGKDSIILKKNNLLFLLQYGNKFMIDDKNFFIRMSYSPIEDKTNYILIENDIKLLNSQYKSLVTSYERKNKIKKIVLNNDLFDYKDDYQEVKEEL